MDTESASWHTALSGTGIEQNQAMSRLHELLLRVAFHEANRRGPSARIMGPELDDIAHQAADDAMLSILGKLDTFRGESRFTTWAYRFVVLEVANKFARHYWRKPQASMEDEDWDRLPSQFGEDPLAHSQHQDLIEAVKTCVDNVLTDHQRKFFVAAVVNGVPMDALAEKTGVKLNAIYKTVFDARRKLRAYLTDNGYIDSVSLAPAN